MGKITKIVDWAKTYKDIIGQRIKRYSWTAALAVQYLMMRGEIGEGVQIKPDIIVGGIPVYHITRLGHGSSDEILKYRSMGGIFLAHQKGGKHTFKFTARIFGPMRHITYKMLEALQIFGTETSKNVLENLNEVLGSHSVSWIDESKNVINPVDLDELGALGSPIIDYTNYAFENETYGFHKTCPIITDTKIYTDMYLETLVSKESEKIGMDAMEIECAFRKYIPPTNFFTTAKNKKTKRTYYSTFIPKKIQQIYKRMDLSINLIWALYMTSIYIDKKHQLFKNDKLIWDLGRLLVTYGSEIIFNMAPGGLIE